MTLWNFFPPVLFPSNSLLPRQEKRSLKKPYIVCYSPHHIALFAAHQPKCGPCLAFVSPPTHTHTHAMCLFSLLRFWASKSCSTPGFSTAASCGLSGWSTLTSLQHNSSLFWFSKIFFPAKCFPKPCIWPGPVSVCCQSTLCIF